MLKIKHQIFETLKVLAKGYGKDNVSKEQLEFYTEILSGELSLEELKASLRKIVKTSKFFPSIAEIIEAARGTIQDQAIDASAKIIKAIGDFGAYQGKEAMTELGDLWHIVEGVGGWKYLCSLSNDDLGILRAQMRDLAKAKISKNVISASKLIDFKGDTFRHNNLEAQKENNLTRIDFQNQLRNGEEPSSRQVSKMDSMNSQKKREGDTL